MAIDQLFLCGTILPGPTGPAVRRGAVAVAAGRVAALLGPAEAADLRRAGCPTADFGATVAVPGVWDAHVHLLLDGLARTQLDLGPARSLAEVADLIRAAVGGGEAEILVAGNLDEGRLAEGRLPTGAELDAVAPVRAVIVIRVDSHAAVVNGAAARRLEIDENWPGVDRDADGRPTGVLRGRANELARARLFGRLGEQAKLAAYRAAAAGAVSRGVVALCALEGGQFLGVDDARLLEEHRAALPVDVYVFPQTCDVAAARRLGLPRLGGCLLVDGSFGSWTAALSEPYADRPGSRGELYFTDDELNALVLTAHAAGLQLAFHAIGDRAVNQLVNAYELAAAEYPRPQPRHRLEHGEFIAPRDWERLAALGVILSAQPAFEREWGGPGGMYERRLGPARRRRTNRLRTALRAGVLLAGGSDANITPVDPLGGIAAAMSHPTPEERLTFAEAFAAFTTGAAASVFAENEGGTLAPGKLASFTVVARDPRALAPAEVAALEVVATVVRGEVVYQK